MKRFVEGKDRHQSALFPERLDDYIAEDNPVRVIDAVVEELNLGDAGFERVVPQVTGRPRYHPSAKQKWPFGIIPMSDIPQGQNLSRRAQLRARGVVGNVEAGVGIEPAYTELQRIRPINSVLRANFLLLSS